MFVHKLSPGLPAAGAAELVGGVRTRKCSEPPLLAQRVPPLFDALGHTSDNL